MDFLAWVGEAVGSETGLFMFKTVATLATAAFGIYGLDVKSRDEAGNFTARGRIVLIGLIASACITGLIQSGEFIQKQKETTTQLESSTRLMRSIQQSLYLLKDVTGVFTIKFKYDGSHAGDFKKQVACILGEIKNEDCNVVLPKKYPGVGCYTVNVGTLPTYPELYMSERSKMFPAKTSSLYHVLEAMDVRVAFYTNHMDENIKTIDYSPHEISRSIGTILNRSIRYNIVNDEFTYGVSTKISQDSISKSGILSLMDMLNGSLVAFMDFNDDYFDDLEKIDCDITDCSTVVDPSEVGIEIELSFPFPKKIRIDNAAVVKINEREHHVSFVNLPNDIEKIDQLGNILP